MESRFKRAVSLGTVYPERCSKLPVSQDEIIRLPRKYEKVRQLSNGSFTNVFLVRKRADGVVSPLYAAKYMKDDKREKNIETDILRKLQHGIQIPVIFDVFHHNFQTILVTEYLSGGNLFERLACPKFQLTEKKCQIFLRQVLDGLYFIHSHGVVHLNITPFNIIFTNRNIDQGLKIIDFGHAIHLSEQNNQYKLSKMQGTLEYLAPEVLHCGFVGPATDIWSAGVVTYMLVSGGVSPFFDGSRLKTMSRILKFDLDFSVDQIRQASEGAKDLIRRMLVPESESRLTAGQALNNPWLLGEDTTAGFQETTIELETSWMRRCLARRRWHRALNTLKAMHVIRKLSSAEYKNIPKKISTANIRMVIEEGLSEPTDFKEFQDKYETIRQIGSGSFGSVYLVKNRCTSELAAAKYLRQEKEKVRTEADILQTLIQSAFVVQLIGLFESPLNSILVTEYLAGGDLITRTAPDDYCLTEHKCRIFIRQIVRGLQFIHGQRIIHLDLKPFNVIFSNPDDDYNLRIIDFGIAEILPESEDSVPMNMCGTLEYMSPEVMDCKFASTASDMWGVGAISYLLLSGGESPFWAGSRYRTMARTLKAQYDFDHNANFSLVSNPAKDFISNLLVLDPEARMSAAACLRHPWLSPSHISREGLSEKEHWMTLETAWMKGILARRRWVRWFHAINAAHRIRRLSNSSFSPGI